MVSRRTLPLGQCFYYLLVSLCYCSVIVGKRSERSPTLVFPATASAMKLIFVLVIPVKKLETGRTINLVTNFQFVYTLPHNSSDVSPFGVYRRRRRRSTDALIDRNVAYQALEIALNRQGVDGNACVLRTICEVAATPLHHDGLLGEILQLLFTPSASETDADADDAYSDAWRRGLDAAECHLAYPLCQHGHGILEYISTLIRLAIKENAFNQTPVYVYALGFKIIWKMFNGTFPHSIKRRSFYEDVESLMDQNGLDGRACVLKYICEASSSEFSENRLFHKVARTLFTIPRREEHQFHPYNVTRNCGTMSHNCPLSILHMQPVT